MRKLMNFLNKQPPYVTISLLYILIIVVGTGLLLIPSPLIAEPHEFSGEYVLNCMFTATSAFSVTGLAVFDTYTHWGILGQVIILVLIQLGGMGFVAIIGIFAQLTDKNLGLHNKLIMKEALNATHISGLMKRVKTIWKGTFITEGVGAALLAIKFIPKMGVGEGIWNSVFLSVSAFCNGGFDLNGKYEQYSSLVEFRSDVLVNITICLLILIGGIGFAVWEDVVNHKWHLDKYSLHSRLALRMTIWLTIIGTFLFFVFELDYTIKGMPFGEKFLASLFSSVTPRTAGFNTVDTGALSPASKILTALYMFIGGSPGSTAGGLKTTTFAALFLTAWANLHGDEDVNVSFDGRKKTFRRLHEDTARKAITVAVVNLTLAITSIILISSIQPEFETSSVLLEVFSAINTVGMTTGITRDLSILSRVIILIMMFVGRVGSVSFALFFMSRNKADKHYITEEIMM